MSNFREMMCETVYGGHLIKRDDVINLGRSDTDHSFSYEYSVTCSRCGKTSIVERKLLEDMLHKDDERPTQFE